MGLEAARLEFDENQCKDVSQDDNGEQSMVDREDGMSKSTEGSLINLFSWQDVGDGKRSLECLFPYREGNSAGTCCRGGGEAAQGRRIIGSRGSYRDLAGLWGNSKVGVWFEHLENRL